MKQTIVFLALLATIISCKKNSTTDNQPTTNPIVITTTSVAQVASRSATINATISNDGGHAITDRGVCYGITSNPTTTNTVIQSGNGLGSYTVSITNLELNTTYYVRTYAINSLGTVYGNELSFTTLGIANLASILIGTQIWQSKNLDVEAYRNGDPIPRIDDATEWANTTSGAYCYFQNQSSYGPTYGKLYNWYAVIDPRGLAPEEWHIPIETEWITLTTFLGGSTIAGGKLKEAGTGHWLSPNTAATNSSGFTALPGEFRGYDGSFSIDPTPGYVGYYWSATLNGFDGVFHVFAKQFGDIMTEHTNKGSGCSVRCVKD